jgi:hypothetical protein
MLRPATAELRRAAYLGGLILAGVGSGCASLPPASPAARDAARHAGTYTANLRVSVRGPDLRGRADAIVGFRRPDALRVELPAGTGLALLAVAREGRLVVAFPADRAFYEGAATPAALGALLGVALAPADLMDVLVGVQPAAVRALDVRWGPLAPSRVVALLADGTRLDAKVREPELGRPLGDAAFASPATGGWQRLSLEEARGRWQR